MKNVLSLEAFLDWVEKKNPNEEFLWSSCRECACAQYARHLGVQDWFMHIVSSNFWMTANQVARRASNWREETVWQRLLRPFGALPELAIYGTWGRLAEELRKEIGKNVCCSNGQAKEEASPQWLQAFSPSTPSEVFENRSREVEAA